MTAPATIDPELDSPAAPTCAATRIRLRFAKRGDLRLVSHHDLMRCLERMLRRASLPVAHSQGFNPRPKATFALAMALGIEGCNEVLDRLRAEGPPGFDFLAAEAVGPGRAARVASALYRMAIPEDRRDEARAAVADLLSRGACPYTRHRPDRTVEIDLRPFVLEAALVEGGDLVLRMKISPEGSARPEEVLDALGLKDLLGRGAVLIRDDVELVRTD